MSFPTASVHKKERKKKKKPHRNLRKNFLVGWLNLFNAVVLSPKTEALSGSD